MRHNNEEALIEFLKSSRDPAYVLSHISWLRQHYPDSVQRMEPIIRKIYSDKTVKR